MIYDDNDKFAVKTAVSRNLCIANSSLILAAPE